MSLHVESISAHCCDWSLACVVTGPSFVVLVNHTLLPPWISNTEPVDIMTKHSHEKVELISRAVRQETNNSKELNFSRFTYRVEVFSVTRSTVCCVCLIRLLESTSLLDLLTFISRSYRSSSITSILWWICLQSSWTQKSTQKIQPLKVKVHDSAEAETLRAS